MKRNKNVSLLEVHVFYCARESFTIDFAGWCIDDRRLKIAKRRDKANSRGVGLQKIPKCSLDKGILCLLGSNRLIIKVMATFQLSFRVVRSVQPLTDYGHEGSDYSLVAHLFSRTRSQLSLRQPASRYVPLGNCFTYTNLSISIAIILNMSPLITQFYFYIST